MKVAIELGQNGSTYVQVIHDDKRLAFVETTQDGAQHVRQQLREMISSLKIPVGTPNAAEDRQAIADRLVGMVSTEEGKNFTGFDIRFIQTGNY